MSADGGSATGPERRGRPDRRQHDRRLGAGRRDEDLREARRTAVEAAVWAVIGALILVYLFFVAIGGISPSDARVVTIVVAVLAVAWLAHAWRRLSVGGYVSRTDRERRGF